MPEPVRRALAESGVPFEILACDPELADTAVFCERYGFALADSANTIVVTSKSGERRYAACVLLATTRLDVNKTVRKRLGVRRISFASPEETERLTGMVLGGVTPLGLPETLPVWVDEQVMARPYVVLGGGNRSTKIKVAPALFERVPNATVVPGLAVEI